MCHSFEVIRYCNNYCLFFRNMEDFVTWVDSSKIRQHVMNYNDEVSFQDLTYVI